MTQHRTMHTFTKDHRTIFQLRPNQRRIQGRLYTATLHRRLVSSALAYHQVPAKTGEKFLKKKSSKWRKRCEYIRQWEFVFCCTVHRRKFRKLFIACHGVDTCFSEKCHNFTTKWSCFQRRISLTFWARLCHLCRKQFQFTTLFHWQMCRNRTWMTAIDFFHSEKSVNHLE